MLVGNLTVPSVRMRILIPQLKNVYQIHPTEEISRDQLAKAMGLNSEGGGFAQKVSDLQNYGLIVKYPNGMFSLTDTAQEIYQTTDKGRLSSLLESVFGRVGLWVEIKKRCGDNPDRSTFWKDLVELTGLDEPTAKKRTEEIIKDYLKDLNYCKSSTIGTAPQTTRITKPIQYFVTPQKSNDNDLSKAHPGIKWTFRLTSDIGNFQLDIDSPATYEMALTLLQTIKKQMDKENEMQRGEDYETK